MGIIKKISIIERGWAGHFCASSKCLFRRNTLIECNDLRVVVSTVGNYWIDEYGPSEIGLERFYETMAFKAHYDGEFWDSDVTKQIVFRAPWSIGYPEADNAANLMHEAVVAEISDRLLEGEVLVESEELPE